MLGAEILLSCTWTDLFKRFFIISFLVVRLCGCHFGIYGNFRIFITRDEKNDRFVRSYVGKTKDLLLNLTRLSYNYFDHFLQFAIYSCKLLDDSKNKK